MHCPQCGQQQMPSEVRFCSRCGFLLSGVTELMANGGMIPAPSVVQDFGVESPKKRGVKQGVALFMGVGIILTSLLGVFNAYLGLPEFFPAMSAVIGFLGGFLRIIFALIFEEGQKKIVYAPQQHFAPPMPQQFHAPAQMAPPRAAVLPSAPNVPVTPWRRPDTAELITPSSVTENTTKLLEKEPPPKE